MKKVKILAGLAASNHPEELWPDRRWRPVPGYESLYLVSEYGQIWSIKAGCLCLLHSDKRGGQIVRLVRNFVHAWPAVHLIVAQVFLKNADPIHNTYVGHINGQRQDNRVKNLRWMHKSALTEHLKEETQKHRAQPVLSPSKYLSKEDVLAIRTAYAAGVSVRTLSKEFGVSITSIHSLLRGDTWGSITSE